MLVCLNNEDDKGQFVNLPEASELSIDPTREEEFPKVQATLFYPVLSSLLEKYIVLITTNIYDYHKYTAYKVSVTSFNTHTSNSCCCHSPLFRNEKIEAQRGSITLSRDHKAKKHKWDSHLEVLITDAVL